MARETPAERAQIIPPRAGLLHVVDAAGYSLAGLRRLLAETAARLELLGALLVAVGFVWHGAAAWHWLAAGVLFALVLAAEALNTAIEVLTDRISPEWSQTAKEAKDLGSFAVGVLLVATGGFVGLVLAGLI
ncbi:diacylglycerol kinase [Gemmobacter sp.]|uniref:diacylglycerol kinase n=1 Tax=Gemmobacter sp. TaxID=1898957 RepID=UPI002B0013E7|nr:diacylglycerol kinase [Gemmobacter sp.]